MKVDNSRLICEKRRKKSCCSLPKKNHCQSQSLEKVAPQFGLYKKNNREKFWKKPLKSEAFLDKRTLRFVSIISNSLPSCFSHPFPLFVIVKCNLQLQSRCGKWSGFDNPAVTEPALILYLTQSRTLYVHRMIHLTILSTVQKHWQGGFCYIYVCVHYRRSRQLLPGIFRSRTRFGKHFSVCAILFHPGVAYGLIDDHQTVHDSIVEY